MKKLITVLLSATLLTGCISTGKKLAVNNINQIQNQVTTESDIRRMFGEPVSLRINAKKGIKVLTYNYKNDDNIKKGLAGVTGAVAGAALGSQIGNGTGQDIAESVGSMLGGFLGQNVVTTREMKQFLTVTIDMKTQKVIDYNYVESKHRSQKIGITTAPPKL